MKIELPGASICPHCAWVQAMANLLPLPERRPVAAMINPGLLEATLGLATWIVFLLLGLFWLLLLARRIRQLRQAFRGAQSRFLAPRQILLPLRLGLVAFLVGMTHMIFALLFGAIPSWAITADPALFTISVTCSLYSPLFGSILLLLYYILYIVSDHCTEAAKERTNPVEGHNQQIKPIAGNPGSG